jgi:hypothetical protein
MERWIALSFFSSNGELILLYKNMPKPKRAGTYDIVLSPQFYILKKEQLPIKYSYQAKRLAPSILEEYLDHNKDYEYVVQKSKDGWKFFAYAPQDIEEFLYEFFDIPANKIGQVYFADQLNTVLSKAPIELDENNALAILDSQATIVPKSMLEVDEYAKFNKKLRPKGGFSFKSSKKLKEGNKTTNKSSIIIAILLSLIAIAYIVEGFSYKKATKIYQDKLLAFYEDSPELQSKLTRDSIKAKYEAIEKKQRSIREQLKNLSKLSSKKTILENLVLNKDNIEASFRVDPKEVKKIKSITANTNLSYTQKDNLFKIKGALNVK